MKKPILSKWAQRLFKAIYRRKIAGEVDGIIAGLDMTRYEELKGFHRSKESEAKFNQHFDLRKNLIDNLYLVHWLRLNKGSGRNILDIGTGKGIFPFLCNRYGHKVTGMDLGDIPRYNDFIEYLGVERKIWEVKAFEPLPDLGRRFDLVTAVLVCFNNHKTDNLWGVKEWDYFLRDLAKNQLTNDGWVFLLLNAEHDGTFYTKELNSYLRFIGARMAQGRVFVQNMEAFSDKAPKYEQ